LAFNFLHPDGSVVDERYVDRLASRHNISHEDRLLLQPRSGRGAFTISRETLVGGEFGEGMTLDDYVRAIGLPSGGAIRASLGLVSSFADLRRFQHLPPNSSTSGACPMTSRLATPAEKRATAGPLRRMR
jgi:hypothetical protein